MYGTNFERSIRLIKYLVNNPKDFPRYITTLFLKWATPLDLGLPWISYSAIDFLTKFLRPNHVVAEFGGGGSTIFFAKRSSKVLCIESDKLWALRIEDRLRKLKLNNVVLQIYPYNPDDIDEFKNSDFLKSIRGNSYDLILIDCRDISAKLRPECFKFAEDYINKGGCIVVDDSWRYPEIQKNHHAKQMKKFSSVGPCRFGVTTTDIYFY